MCHRVQASAALLLRPPRATAPETAPTRATSWCVPRSPSLSSSRAEPTWRLKPSKRVSATRWRLAGARGGHDRHDYAAHPLTRRSHAAARTAGARPGGRLQYGGAAGLLVARRRREALSASHLRAAGGRGPHSLCLRRVRYNSIFGTTRHTGAICSKCGNSRGKRAEFGEKCGRPTPAKKPSPEDWAVKRAGCPRLGLGLGVGPPGLRSRPPAGRMAHSSCLAGLRTLVP